MPKPWRRRRTAAPLVGAELPTAGAAVDGHQSCDGALLEAPVDQVLAAVRALTAFFQRAAGNRDAVLFREA